MYAYGWGAVCYKLTLNLSGIHGNLDSSYLCDVLEQGSIAENDAKIGGV